MTVFGDLTIVFMVVIVEQDVEGVVVMAMVLLCGGGGDVGVCGVAGDEDGDGDGDGRGLWWRWW